MDENLLCAEMVLSSIFQKCGIKKLPVKGILKWAKDLGVVSKKDIKAARKSLGVKSQEDQDGEFWWIWPEDTDPGEVNKIKSQEFWNS